MITRDKTSHKGQNGKVAVIGGSETFHGAPIFAGLAAEATGVDLIFPIVPPCHKEVIKQASYNFICNFFSKNNLGKSDLKMIRDILTLADVLVIGPGLSTKPESIKTVLDIIRTTKIPMVIDASGLQAIAKMIEDQSYPLPPFTVLTPHKGELKEMVKSAFIEEEKKKNFLEITKIWAQKLGTNIVLKGETDCIISSEGKISTNKRGNAGLTVGGTGDAFSGVIAGLIAQKIDPYKAALLGTKIIGLCGEKLFKEKGYAYTTMDVIEKIPYVLKDFRLRKTDII